MVGELLDAATTAADRGDAAIALARLVDAWRVIPDRALAEAIEAIGPVAAKGRALPAPDDDRSPEAPWLAAAAVDDAAMRGVLLANVREAYNVAHRFTLLAEHPDPRIASAIVAELLDAKKVSRRALDRWVPLTDALFACGDPRTAARANAIVEVWSNRRFGNDTKAIEARAKRLAKFLQRMAARFPEPVALDLLAGEHARLAHIVACLTAPPPTAAADAATEQALLAAIYANPADDALRAVYADWLLDRGDRLGEFIALQLRPDHERSRVQALERVFSDRIIGRLAPYVRRWTSERGFVGTAQVETDPPPDPAWATVRRVSAGMPATDQYPMPDLRAASYLNTVHVVHLASLASPPPLSVLHVLAPTPEMADAFPRLRLPGLRRLEVDNRVLDASALPPWQHLPIATLAANAVVDGLPAWHALFATSTTLERIELRAYPWKLELTRVSFAADGPANDGGVPALASVIALLPPLEKIRIVPGGRAWRVPARQAITEALRRHPDAVIDIPNYEPPRRPI